MAGYQACESPDKAAGGLSDDDWFVCDDEVKTPASKVSKMGGPLTPKPLTPGRPTQDLGAKMNAMTEENMAAEVACRQRAASQQAAKSAAHKKLHLGIWKTSLKRTPQKRPQPLTSGGDGSEVAPRTATEQGKPATPVLPLQRPAETVGAKVGAEVGSNLQKTVGRPKAENATIFAGRRPPVTPGQDPLWDLRKQLYWTVRKEMAEQYPGKVHRMPSAHQTKYWKFMSDFMKSHPACPGEPSRETLKQGAQAYLELLAEELKSRGCRAAGRRMLRAEGELVFNSETSARATPIQTPTAVGGFANLSPVIESSEHGYPQGMEEHYGGEIICDVHQEAEHKEAEPYGEALHAEAEHNKEAKPKFFFV